MELRKLVNNAGDLSHYFWDAVDILYYDAVEAFYYARKFELSQNPLMSYHGHYTFLV